MLAAPQKAIWSARYCPKKQKEVEPLKANLLQKP